MGGEGETVPRAVLVETALAYLLEAIDMRGSPMARTDPEYRQFTTEHLRECIDKACALGPKPHDSEMLVDPPMKAISAEVIT